MKDAVMKEEFVPYDLALELKKLKFNKPCFATYMKHACVGNPFEFNLDYHSKVELDHSIIPINSEYTKESKWISAPLWQQAFDFFRDEYKLDSEIYLNHDGKTNRVYSILILSLKGNVINWESKDSTLYKTYQEAKEKLLVLLIELSKNKKNKNNE